MNKDFDSKMFDALMAVITEQRNDALNQVVLATATSKRLAERVKELEQENATIKAELASLQQVVDSLPKAA